MMLPKPPKPCSLTALGVLHPRLQAPHPVQDSVAQQNACHPQQQPVTDQLMSLSKEMTLFSMQLHCKRKSAPNATLLPTAAAPACSETPPT